MTNKHIKLIIISIIFTNISVLAQPHISGSVELNREKGLFLCEFELSNIPEVSHYRILLNHGMNIKSIVASEALENGISRDDYANFSDTYLKSESFEKNVLDYINKVFVTN